MKIEFNKVLYDAIKCKKPLIKGLTIAAYDTPKILGFIGSDKNIAVYLCEDNFAYFLYGNQWYNFDVYNIKRIPKDWKNPDWDKTEKIHDWKNHIHDQIQQIWNTFTNKQKKILAECAEADALAEEWD